MPDRQNLHSSCRFVDPVKDPIVTFTRFSIGPWTIDPIYGPQQWQPTKQFHRLIDSAFELASSLTTVLRDMPENVVEALKCPLGPLYVVVHFESLRIASS